MKRIAVFTVSIFLAQYAFSESDIKRAVYSDCAEAHALVTTLPFEQKVTFTTFINNLLKAKESLAARSANPPAPGTPNRIGVAPIDEPKIGELVTINNSERDQTAKECALSLLPELLPESLRVIPTLLAAESDSTNKESFRVEAPRAIARMSAKVTEENQILSLIDLSVRELEQHKLAGAENIIFELFDRKTDFIIDRFIISSLSDEKISHLLSLLLHSTNEKLFLAQSLIKEGGKKRAVGIILLHSLPQEALLDAEVVRTAFESLDAVEFKDLRIQIIKALQVSPNPVLDAVVTSELHTSLKGADSERKKEIVTLAASLPTISLELENEILPLVREYQPELIDALIALSKKASLKKKLREDLLKLAKYTSREEFSKLFLALNEAQESTLEFLTFCTSLLPKDLKNKDRSIIERTFLINFKKALPTEQKKLIDLFKSAMKQKGISPAYKMSVVRVLTAISPTTITNQQATELLLNGSCDLLQEDVLVQKTKLPADALFARLIACVQVGESSMEDVSLLLKKDLIPLDTRRSILSQWVTNQLYDRRFRSELSELAAPLGVPLEKIASTLLLLIADTDENVWNHALSALSQYQKSAANLVDELLKVSNPSSSQFRLKQIRVALQIQSEASTVSLESLKTLMLEEIENRRFSVATPFAGISEEVQNSLYERMIEEFPVDLRAKALIELAKSPIRLNEPLERGVLSQINSKVSSVSDAAITCAMTKGIVGAQLLPHLYDTIFSTAREQLFELRHEGISIDGDRLIELLKGEQPKDSQLMTFKIFEAGVK